MKAFAWVALALMTACLGCTQGGSKASEGVAGRLQKLETSFESFQQDQLLVQKERQARDAEIDAKLNQIATRLDSLAPGAKSGKVARPAKPVRQTPAAGGSVPFVAGQVIPMTAFSTPSARVAAQAPAPTPAPLAQASQPQPQAMTPNPSGNVVQPAGKVQLGQVEPLQSVQPQSQPAANTLGLNPPVVTLSLQQHAPQPYATQQQAVQARKPTPYEAAPRSGTSRSRSRAASSREASETPSPVAERQTPPAAPAAAPATPAASAGKNDPVEAAQLYADGMRAISTNKNDDGRRKMNELLTKYPGSDKAPLALYWVGESYMNERSYNQAILAFKDLTTRYPKSFKAPESVYKVAEAYERLGDKSNAIFHLKLLADEYPGSELAGKAKQKLKQLGQ